MADAHYLVHLSMRQLLDGSVQPPIVPIDDAVEDTDHLLWVIAVGAGNVETCNIHRILESTLILSTWPTVMVFRRLDVPSGCVRAMMQIIIPEVFPDAGNRTQRLSKCAPAFFALSSRTGSRMIHWPS